MIKSAYFSMNFVQNPKYMRPEELPYLKGDSTKIRTELGWTPKYSFEMLMDEMTEHWLKIYGKNDINDYQKNMVCS